MSLAGADKARLGPRGWIRIGRWITFAVAGGALLYLVSRFDLLGLPEEGCSPVSLYSPGCTLLVDRWARDWREGDCVFVSDEDGLIHMALLSSRDPEGRWWIGSDVDDCPGVEPERIGWVPEEGLLGRVILAFGQ